MKSCDDVLQSFYQKCKSGVGEFSPCFALKNKKRKVKIEEKEILPNTHLMDCNNFFLTTQCDQAILWGIEEDLEVAKMMKLNIILG